LNEYAPDPWSFLLLGLAAWRMWKLIASDLILERPVDSALRRLEPAARRTFWREFLACSYCSGTWLALIWWGAWMLWPTGTTIAAVPWALAAVVGLLGTAWDALSD